MHKETKRTKEKEFYRGNGFDRITGPEAGLAAEFQSVLEQQREGLSLKGNLYEERVRADFPGNQCILPINWLLMPERQFDHVLLRAGPGEGFPVHTHGYGDEIYLVISGHGTVILGDEYHQAGPHDIFHIPAGTPHGYQVPETATETFDLFVVNTPAVDKRNRSRYWAAEPQPPFDKREHESERAEESAGREEAR